VFLNHVNKYGVFTHSFSLKVTSNVSNMKGIIEKNGKFYLAILIQACAHFYVDDICI
jgi:hypothetical protein